MSFDPRRTGPLDLARQTHRWASENARELGGGGLVILVVAMFTKAQFGWELPEVPNAVLVLMFAAIGGAVLGYYPTKALINWLYSEDTEILVELDGSSGDLGVIEISEDRFSRMTVLDHDGNEQSTAFLHTVSLKSGRTAREVDHYDPETNTAVASWMADATNRDLRKHKHGVDYVKRQLSIEADKSLDALVNTPEVLRAQGSVIANSMIRAVEGVETPGNEEAQIYKQMWDTVESEDISGDLLSDHETDDVDSAIREFVEEEGLEESSRTEDLIERVKGNGADTDSEEANS